MTEHTPAGGVIERAVFRIKAGDENAFEAAYAQASRLLLASSGCHGVRMHRGIESPATYLLLVHWAALEDHTVGFRESAAFGQWRALLQEHFDGPPEVEHYTPLVPAAAEG
jgi:heme-degrading monooxygenase HmoA